MRWCASLGDADAHSSTVGLEVADVGVKQKDLLGTLFLKADLDFAAVAGDGMEHNMYC